MELDEALYLVKRYEDETERPTSTRLTAEGFGRIRRVVGISDSEILDEAAACETYLRWCEQVDDVLAYYAPEELHGHMTMLPWTPPALREVGLHNLPIQCTEHHLLQIMHERSAQNRHWHGLPEHIVKSLPEWISRPAIVADDPSRKNSLLLVLPILDTMLWPDGSASSVPIIVPMLPNGSGYIEMQPAITNFVTTVFGPDGACDYFGHGLRPGHVVRIDAACCRLVEDSVPGIFDSYADLPRDVVLRRPSCLDCFDRRQARNEGFLRQLYRYAAESGVPIDLGQPVKPPYRLG